MASLIVTKLIITECDQSLKIHKWLYDRWLTNCWLFFLRVDNSWHSGGRHFTVWWPSLHLHLTGSWPSLHRYLTIWWPSRYCHLTLWWPSHHCHLTISWPSHHRHLTISWPSSQDDERENLSRILHTWTWKICVNTYIPWCYIIRAMEIQIHCTGITHLCVYIENMAIPNCACADSISDTFGLVRLQLWTKIAHASVLYLTMQ